MKDKFIGSIVRNAIIIAIIGVMSFIPYVGYIQIPPVSITIIHIAVIFFAWMFGWKEGLVAGFAFGMFSLFKALSSPVGMDYFFINPLVSVLPRTLFGFVSGLIFDLLRLIRQPKTRFVLDILVIPALTLFHSVLTLSILYGIYHGNEAFASYTYLKVIMTIMTLNGLIEIVSATVVVPLLIIPLNKAFPQYEAIYRRRLKDRKKVSVYDTITLNTHHDLLKNLAKFVAINSVLDEKTIDKENPFGVGVSNALNFIATLAKEDGFEVKNYANKVVEITCGHGKNITILAHADVVPPGNGWDQNPFEMVDRGETLTGRGVADDKGPLLAAYYAMKAVRDNHIMGDYQIRFIVGGNEETGSKGVEYYFKVLKKPQPDLGFSPDAEFPLIFAEKGIINFEVKSKQRIKHVDFISGGEASNAVIDKCEVKMDNDENFVTYLKENNIDVVISQEEEKMTLVFNGKSAHGSTPEEGVNAGIIALNSLAAFYKNDKLAKLVESYSNLQGYGVNAYGNSEEMGHNSLNVGIVKYDGKQLSMIVNFRYVDTCESEELKNNIVAKSKPATVSFLGEAPLLYYKQDSTLVSTLLHAYQAETNDYTSQAKAIGGGTYAKEADNIIAFGMEFPGWNSHMHSPGEQVRKADLFKSVSIYARAIVELGKKLNENEI